MATASQFHNTSLEPETVTILSGQTTSDAINLYATTLMIIKTPAALTGTSFTFLGSIDAGSTFVQVRDKFGAALTFTVAVDGAYIVNDAATFAGFDQIKIVSSASEAADRTVKLKFSPI
jgi:hypothetical protein